MTTILALDSSSENCSVAVYHEHEITLCSEHAPRKHTQLILPLTKAALAKAELSLPDVTAIAFGAGPGSFTGIRIAAGVAQGLAYGLDVPIYAISNLEALAIQSFLEHGESNVLCCIDARMGEVYWGLFDVSVEKLELGGKAIKRYDVKVLGQEQVTSPDLVELPESASEVCFAGIGSGIALLPDSTEKLLKVKNVEAQPRADTIAYLADRAIVSGKLGELKDALPSYVRDTVTWNKLPGRE